MKKSASRDQNATQDTQPQVSVEAIVANGLCTGCGLCASLGGDAISMQMTREGYERPRVEVPLDAATTRLVNSVCPGVRVSGPSASESASDVEDNLLWGRTHALFRAHAIDPELRFICSSGGVLAALALYLLEKGEVDYVLHVAASERRPLRNRVHLSRNREDVLRAAGSRYGPAAPLVDLNSLLQRKRPFAFIGKPCDVTALANLALHDDRVDRYLRFRFAMFCGGVSALGKSLEPLEPHGVTEGQISLYRYRGHGNPGLTHVETVDGRSFDFRYVDLWEQGTQHLQFRCKICPDAIGLHADIVVHDVWPGGPPEDDVPSLNGVIARTSRGMALLDAAIAADAIKVTGSYDFAELAQYQPHQAERRRAIAPRLAAMRDAGALCPRFEGLHLDEVADELSESERSAEYRGTLERLARGSQRENP